MVAMIIPIKIIACKIASTNNSLAKIKPQSGQPYAYINRIVAINCKHVFNHDTWVLCINSGIKATPNNLSQFRYPIIGLIFNDSKNAQTKQSDI